ncbi:MAG: amidohydrolase family protein [Allosphingosinicella sp.]|uniref:amidohydrolase family protein n=1 Tax=Allosphingosinicella sp. TaxID=2823234 RepID=UPI00392DC383
MTFRHATILLAAALGACSHVPAAPERHVYHGMTLIDPATHTVRPNGWLAVEGTRIAAVGEGRPPAGRGTVLHDRTGLFAMPGLIDSHAHVTLGPTELAVVDGAPRLSTRPRPDIARHNARHLLSFGVTTIRNPAGDLAANRDYSALVAAGTLAGPEAFHAGEVIDRPQFPFDGLVTQPGEGRSVGDIVRAQAAGGADFVKFYTDLTEADLREGVAAARAAGRPTIAHLSDVSWTTAARLGIGSLVHMMPISPDLLPADRRAAYVAARRGGAFAFFEWWEAADLDSPEIAEMIDALVRNRVNVDATLMAFLPAFWGDQTEVRDRDLALVHPDMAANWRSFRFDLGWQPDDYRRARAVWPKMLELTRRMHEAGVPMTIGTDLANPFVAPGISMAREMALHREAGIPAWAVLRMATSEGARLLGIAGRVGRLHAGQEADILFLGADPLQDMMAVADVRGVIVNGAALDPLELRAGEAGR